MVIGILIIVNIIIILAMCSVFIPSSKADETKKIIEVDFMEAVCEKCNREFVWEETDALVKYKYGNKYIVHCPFCDKLTKVEKNK